jgi:hypothetical protein
MNLVLNLLFEILILVDNNLLEYLPIWFHAQSGPGPCLFYFHVVEGQSFFYIIIPLLSSSSVNSWGASSLEQEQNVSISDFSDCYLVLILGLGDSSFGGVQGPGASSSHHRHYYWGRGLVWWTPQRGWGSLSDEIPREWRGRWGHGSWGIFTFLMIHPPLAQDRIS